MALPTYSFFRKLYWRAKSMLPGAVLRSHGYCPTCGVYATFSAHNPWLRDYFRCANCASIPRERALMVVIESYYPTWRHCVVHESSPCGRGASARFMAECAQYMPSQYFPGESSGRMVNGMLCENLEALTFSDASIDLHITQDVLEHVFDPAQIFREIARTLKPGGAHIFTVPLVKKHAPSRPRAARAPDGSVEYLQAAQYHGNPVSKEGSLVTMDWGFDIVDHIREASGLETEIITLDDLSRGIRAEFIEVLVTRKP